MDFESEEKLEPEISEYIQEVLKKTVSSRESTILFRTIRNEFMSTLEDAVVEAGYDGADLESVPEWWELKQGTIPAYF
ncbi:hypothetical protein KC865_01550 [Candidatus Kaiserbacteria bacterium]|nr:hypothetical protein [Candidatus Kaiserbacteria bacterium]